MRRKRVFRNSYQRVGSYTSSPEFFAQPVSDFGRAVRNVLLQHESYATDSFVSHCDCEVDLGLVFSSALEPTPRINSSIGIRKAVAQIDPNVSVVGVSNYRVKIAPPPASHLAR